MINTEKDRGVLLVNLGSPDSTSVKDVRKYLNQFLMDKYVIDVPYPIRRMIVSLFILPFRPKESAHAYESIWWEDGSPLIVLSEKLQKAVRDNLDMPVELAMRYGNPSIEHGIQQLLKQNPQMKEIFLFPLYPHYAMATVTTVVTEVQDTLQRLGINVRLTVQPPFYDNPAYISALVDSTMPYLEDDFDMLLMSYHGIPERHCRKTDVTGKHCLKVDNCCQVASIAHQKCYRHQCYRTSEEFIKMSGIPAEKVSVSFQSRLGKDPWLTPFTDKEIVRFAEQGVKKLAVMCPAFVSDCLETLEEIGMRAKEDFIEAGGESFTLIPCLNMHPAWVELVSEWSRTGEMASISPYASKQAIG